MRLTRAKAAAPALGYRQPGPPQRVGLGGAGGWRGVRRRQELDSLDLPWLAALKMLPFEDAAEACGLGGRVGGNCLQPQQVRVGTRGRGRPHSDGPLFPEGGQVKQSWGDSCRAHLRWAHLAFRASNYHGFRPVLGAAGPQQQSVVCRIVQVICILLCLAQTLCTHLLVTFSPAPVELPGPGSVFLVTIPSGCRSRTGPCLLCGPPRSPPVPRHSWPPNLHPPVPHAESPLPGIQAVLSAEGVLD